MDRRCATYVLAYVGVGDEELCAQILFCDGLMVCKCDGAYAGEDEVFCDFVGKGLDGDEEDVGGADSVGVSSGLHGGSVGGLTSPAPAPPIAGSGDRKGQFHLRVVSAAPARARAAPTCGDFVGLSNGSDGLSSRVVRGEGAIGRGRRYAGRRGEVRHGRRVAGGRGQRNCRGGVSAGSCGSARAA